MKVRIIDNPQENTIQYPKIRKRKLSSF